MRHTNTPPNGSDIPRMLVQGSLATRNASLMKAPMSSGRNNLLKHLKGERLTRNQAIIAKCCECNAYYVDGREDCKMPDCPLYPFMPYRAKF